MRYYTRYMDDCVLIHQDRDELTACLVRMREFVEKELHVSFNEKTEIFPIKNGVDYLGWHFYLTDTGKVIRKVKQSIKTRCKRKLCCLKKAYEEGNADLSEIKQVFSSYRSHLSFGHTYKLQKKVLGEFALKSGEQSTD